MIDIVNLFASIHFSICLIPEVTFFCSLTKFLCFITNTMSSALNLTAKFAFSGKSFMYNKSNSGPSVEPWGTPHVPKQNRLYLQPYTVFDLLKTFV